MDEQYLIGLMKLIMPKSAVIMNQLKHELISLGHEIKFNDVQDAAIEAAIQGALISGMKFTFEQLYGKMK